MGKTHVLTSRECSRAFNLFTRLISMYFVPGTILRALASLIHLVLIMNPSEIRAVLILSLEMRKLRPREVMYSDQAP